jgi:hypothetical protein
MINKIIPKIILVFLGAITALCIWWEFIQPNKVITDVKNLSPPTQTVVAGDMLEVRRHFCLNTPLINAKVHREIQNEFVYYLPDSAAPTEAGCRDRTFRIEIPINFHPGSYTYYSRIEYRLNPLRYETVRFPSVKFTVVNPIFDKLKEKEKE